MVGSYSYFFLNCTASNMVVCLERRGKIFYRETLHPGEAARVRSKTAGRFAFTVCCRTDCIKPPHLGDSFRNFWGEHLEATTPLGSSSINLESAPRGDTTSTDRESATARSSNTSINREPVKRRVASVDRKPTAAPTTCVNRGATPPRTITTRSAELLAAAISNKNVNKHGGDAVGVGRPAASISSSRTKENNDGATRGDTIRGGGRGNSRTPFPGTREGEGGRARRKGGSRSICTGMWEGGERGTGGGGGSRSSSCSGGGGHAKSRAVVAASEVGVVEEPVRVRGHAIPLHQPRHYKYRRPHFFAMCDTFCAFGGGGAEAISLHDLNEKIFRSYEPIIRRGEL